jgi:hypothetical protein
MYNPVLIRSSIQQRVGCSGPQARNIAGALVQPVPVDTCQHRATRLRFHRLQPPQQQAQRRRKHRSVDVGVRINLSQRLGRQRAWISLLGPRLAPVPQRRPSPPSRRRVARTRTARARFGLLGSAAGTATAPSRP